MVCLKLSVESDTPEWSLIELQGTVILPEDWEEETVVDLGTLTLSSEVAWGRIITKYKDGLHWKTSTKERINTRHVKVDVKVENQDVVQMTFGHHQMEGKVATLKKPLAIIDPTVTIAEDSLPERKIIGVIKQKYVFKARPRPLITKPEF